VHIVEALNNTLFLCIQALYQLSRALMRVQWYWEAKTNLTNALEMMLRWSENYDELAIMAEIYYDLANCIHEVVGHMHCRQHVITCGNFV
jgi:hypothetical protein